MNARVCLLASSLEYPEGAGQLWVFLNWALGFRALGCEVTWLEFVPQARAANRWLADARALKTQLGAPGLDATLALAKKDGTELEKPVADEFSGVDAAAEADLVVDLQYDTPDHILRRFRRSVLVDIDPGLMQVWHSRGAFRLHPHDVYFTIGETVGQPGAFFPDCGVRWHFTPPPVFLPAWPLSPAGVDAPFTTITHFWYGEMELNGETFLNDKRVSFLEFLELPSQVRAPLEIAVALGDNREERRLWEEHGWRIRDAWEVAGSQAAYRDYIQASRGEFSCAKPSCMRLQNAWMSDRTICYLASGRPAIVQHTGPSRFLPEGEGLFRFRTMDEAVAAFEAVQSDYQRHSTAARQLAEEYFDATKVARHVLETALD